eukprot:1158309-Pelagomonas_calceolata.AAC.21
MGGGRKSSSWLLGRYRYCDPRNAMLARCRPQEAPLLLFYQETGTDCMMYRQCVGMRAHPPSTLLLWVKACAYGCKHLVRPAQHDLHTPEQVPQYLFGPSKPDQARRNSTHPDAILFIPYPTYHNRQPTSPSYRQRALCSMRSKREMGSSTTLVWQPDGLVIQNRHIDTVEVGSSKDTRSGAHLEASQQQHRGLCKETNLLRSLSTQSSWVWVGLYTCPYPGSV